VGRRLTQINADKNEEIGLLVDKAENLLTALQMPLPPHIHLEGLKCGLEEMLQSLREIYREDDGNG